MRWAWKLCVLPRKVHALVRVFLYKWISASLTLICGVGIKNSTFWTIPHCGLSYAVRISVRSVMSCFKLSGTCAALNISGNFNSWPKGNVPNMSHLHDLNKFIRLFGVADWALKIALFYYISFFLFSPDYEKHGNILILLERLVWAAPAGVGSMPWLCFIF